MVWNPGWERVISAALLNFIRGRRRLIRNFVVDTRRKPTKSSIVLLKLVTIITFENVAADFRPKTFAFAAPTGRRCPGVTP